MCRVDGPAVAALQGTFAENWLESCGEMLVGPDYFPELDPSGSSAKALVVNSTPSAGGSTRARILFQLLIAAAQKSIHITTPYFLPDLSLRKALARAAKENGVDVRLVVPGNKSDHFQTRHSSHRLYGRLLEAGARIFEYQPAMIHAKVLIVDGVWSVIGSTNFDSRSFRINDEVNVAIYDESVASRLEQDFARDVANSREISYEQWRHRSLLQRLDETVALVFERQE
jgi:cardiolipin synthase